ncbi:MAG: hypothetical protein H6733_15320 [Alphaproteobacteria bacterium]|nr:hypothetical protein [Alphaproteobacteria bacterium]
MRPRLLVVPALLSAACSPVGVRGAVDGETPKLLDAVYYALPGAFDDDDGLMILFTGYPRACVTQRKTLERLATIDETDAAASAQDKADLWRELYPDGYWDIVATARVPDAVDTFDAVKLDGVDWEASPQKDDEFGVAVTQFQQRYDEAWFRGDAPASDYTLTWIGDEGALTLTRTERDGPITGTLDIDIVDPDDGSDAGTLAITFKADACTDVDPTDIPDL